ncbi:hypothetical protein BIV57_04730 [Mangrovactinospora gilvigrisea]|uniref:NADPH-dependent FMN reductase-like domain-containing protein n=1 Tax=Mangrovactinospora gilvigrisea TaxID=1428644 RepID=A0A1J7BIR8_9ACTN|nr:NADPH-dependent FMN reductase [Mangrovactinospora gilvigrisea]OIV38567.1 hypothetical protein BIV57_04730 [Mangrovactinospora gilvigrisea]
MSRVLAISGSIRANSFNTHVLHNLQSLAPAGMLVEVYKGIEELPHFSEDLEANPPAQVLRLRQAIQEADGLVISTPEYNRHIPGVLKNALDWASRPYAQGVLTGKNVVVLSAFPSNAGGLTANLQLRNLLSVVNAYVVGGPIVSIPEVHSALAVQADSPAVLANEATRGMIAKNLDSLERAVQDNTGAKHAA